MTERTKRRRHGTAACCSLLQLSDTYDLCITGDSLAALLDLGAAATYIPLTQVRRRGIDFCPFQDSKH